MSPVADAVKHELCVMDDTGDSKLIWEEDNQAEVDAAKQMFDSLKKKGYLAYKVDKRGDKAEVIDHFDRSLEKIIMAPQMKGG